MDILWFSFSFSVTFCLFFFEEKIFAASRFRRSQNRIIRLIHLERNQFPIALLTKHGCLDPINFDSFWARERTSEGNKFCVKLKWDLCAHTARVLTLQITPGEFPRSERCHVNRKQIMENITNYFSLALRFASQMGLSIHAVTVTIFITLHAEKNCLQMKKWNALCEIVSNSFNLFPLILLFFQLFSLRSFRKRR